MGDYKIVKYCRMCKKRYVVNRGESRKNYCDKCQVKMDEYFNNENNESTEVKK